MPLEDNGGAPADSMAVGSNLKYLRFFVFWNLKPTFFFFFKAQTLGKKVFWFGLVFFPNYFSFKHELFYFLKGKKSTLLHSCFV